MILVWDHSHGKQEQQDLVVCRPYAIPESYEEAEMIDSGWLALDRPIYHEGRLQECFYQSRSTRIQLKNYRAPKTEATHRGEKIQMMEIYLFNLMTVAVVLLNILELMAEMSK